jgi:ketosteroid isomerase-like protein
VDENEYAERFASVAARIRRLADIDEIKALQRTYIRSLADREFETMLDDFTDDAIVDIRGHGAKHGRGEIGELFDRMHSMGTPPDGYQVTSPVIEVEGDQASGVWTWHRHFTELPVMGGGMRIGGPWWEGRYRCVYRRVDGRWKFAELYFRLAAPERDADAVAILAPVPLPKAVLV